MSTGFWSDIVALLLLSDAFKVKPNWVLPFWYEQQKECTVMEIFSYNQLRKSNVRPFESMPQCQMPTNFFLQCWGHISFEVDRFIREKDPQIKNAKWYVVKVIIRQVEYEMKQFILVNFTEDHRTPPSCRNQSRCDYWFNFLAPLIDFKFYNTVYQENVNLNEDFSLWIVIFLLYVV